MGAEGNRPRPSRRPGLVVMLLGTTMTAGSSILTGILAGEDIANGTLGEGYSLTRMVLVVDGLAVALGLLIWWSGDRNWLFWIALTMIAGFLLGAYRIDDLGEGGSGGSTSDVAFALGGPAMLIGAFIWWGGAQLMRPQSGQASVPPFLQRPEG
jgi:hypothetical protein